MNPLELTLGIMSALGGFVDIGELVFTMQAGARYGYALLWAIVLGGIGIAVYAEMCGRIVAVSKRPVFDLIRERLGFTAGFWTLIAANLMNIVTCAAELGGVALIFQMLLGFPYRLLLIAAVLLFILIIWILPFQWIERLFGLMGLFMLTFVAAAIATNPDWLKVAQGVVPQVPKLKPFDYFVYGYYIVGLLGATLMPYEAYFYSSGGREENWSPENLLVNKMTAYVGFGLGSILSIALIILAANVFLPRGITPEFISSSALAVSVPFGKIGLFAALTGMFFAVGGAAVETALATAYNLAQFFGWEWGRYKQQRGAPLFTMAWMVVFFIALGIDMTGIDPVMLTEAAVIFSVMALPLTYLPILLTANDTEYMGKYRNGEVTNALGWVFLIIITLVAVLAVPLFIASQGGQG